MPSLRSSNSSTNLTVYRASAGTGKTYTLAVEYISRILHRPSSDEPSKSSRAYREVLAITFTNKATKEMKTRILEFLALIANGRTAGNNREEYDNLIDTLRERTLYGEEYKHISIEELEMRAQTARLQILHDYDHFYVQTIDKFFQYLMAYLAFELGQSANFRVDINDKEAVAQGVSKLIKDNNEGLTNKPLEKLLETYLDERLNNGEKWDSKEALTKFAQKNVLNDTFQENFFAFEALFSNPHAIKPFENYWQNVLKAHKKRGALYCQMEKRVDKLQKSVTALQSQGKVFNQEARLTAAINKMLSFYENDFSGMEKFPSDSVKRAILWNKHGEEQQEYMTLLGWEGANDKEGDDLVKYFKGKDCKEGSAIYNEFVQFWKEFAEALKSLNEAYEHYNTARIILDNLQAFKLLINIGIATDEVNAQHSRILLKRTKQLIQTMVKDTEFPFIFEKAGTRFSHVMIDEFQDTAAVQWASLKNLLTHVIDLGGTGLIVGDIKQSIYRFNGGDWTLLQKKLDEEERFKILPKSLDTNFRSQRRIVEFNNRFFAHASKNLAQIKQIEDLEDIYKEKNIRANKCEEAGYVRVETYDSQNQDILKNGDLERAIQNLHDNYHIPYSEMAILVRKKQQGTDIINYFASKGSHIKFVSEEAFIYESSYPVMLLIYSLRYLQSYRSSTKRCEDKNALAHILKIYWNIIKGENIAFETLLEERENKLPTDFKNAVDELRNMPLYEAILFIAKAFELGNADTMQQANGQTAMLLKFFDEVQVFLQNNSSDIRLFLKYLDDYLCKKSTPTAATDGIQILTVHKSKGLAFHTVLLPFCDWEFMSNLSRQDFLWAKTKEVKQEMPFKFFPVKKTNKTAHSSFKKEYNKEVIAEIIDSFNLLYVAMTRPKENLLIWANHSNNTPKDSPPMAHIGDVVQHAISTMGAVASEAHNLLLEIGTPTPYKHKDTQPPATDNYADAINRVQFNMNTEKLQFRQSQEVQRLFLNRDSVSEHQLNAQRLGNLRHEILSHIITESDLQKAANIVMQKGGCNALEAVEIVDYLKHKLETIRDREWFCSKWQVLNERSIFDPCAPNDTKCLRPDRIIVKGKHAIVIDYKFYTELKNIEENKRQVRYYMNLLSDIGFSEVEGYLWYVEQETVITIDH